MCHELRVSIRDQPLSAAAMRSSGGDRREVSRDFLPPKNQDVILLRLTRTFYRQESELRLPCTKIAPQAGPTGTSRVNTRRRAPAKRPLRTQNDSRDTSLRPLTGPLPSKQKKVPRFVEETKPAPSSIDVRMTRPHIQINQLEPTDS